MGTTDHPFPGPDDRAADADAPPHESSSAEGDGEAPAESSGPGAPAAAAPDAAEREAVVHPHEPDVMSEFRCVSAAEPEPDWGSSALEVFTPPPVRVPSEETAEPAVESPAPEPTREPEAIATRLEPDPEAAIVAAVERQPKEPEPAVDAVAVIEPEQVSLSEAAQPVVDTEPPVAIEATMTPATTDPVPTPVEREPLATPESNPEPAWTSHSAGAASAVAVPLPAAAPRRWTRNELKSIGVRAAKVAGIVFTAWFCTVLFLIVIYRFINPPFSSLMLQRALTGTSIEQDWVPLRSISPSLRRAVIVSEDGRFCSHWGIDFAEIAAALKRTSGGIPRGASTITMQVAKNLFLWPAKSYVRKIVEVPLTYAIEMLWPKRRILEVYLNIAEWGPGIFGAEAAAQAHFGQSAASLGPRQSAQLAVSLPNPLRRNAGAPGAWTSRRASVIQRRAISMRSASSCVDAAR
jgi:monofunctional biosynthetic peptidoglycan transglycosylase